MRKAITILQGLLMAFAAFMIVSFVYTIVTSVFILITGKQDINSQADYCLMVIAVMISILMFYLWYKRYANRDYVGKADTRDIIRFKSICLYLMIGVGCQLFVSGILVIIRPVFETLFSYYDNTVSSLFNADPIVVAVYVIILAPIIEELMLRGILYGRLRQGIQFTVANIIQASVFGLYHWDIIQGIYAFGIGLILGYTYEKTRTLLVPIIVHVIINGSGFLLQELSLGQYIPVALAVITGGALLYAGLYLFDRNIDYSDKE
jgi:membrane protease YdiL (CAAX protease family)